MRIAFFITEEYSFTFPLLEKVIPRLEEEHTVCGILRFPDTLTGLTGIHIPLKYLELFGYPTTAKLAARTISDRIGIFFRFLFRKSWCHSFAQMAGSRHIPFLNFGSPNEEEVIRWVREEEVDVIFIFIGHILKSGIIRAPRCCIINKHGSILPANRGVLPVFWAMLKEEEIGFSLHKVTEKLDSGDVLFQKVYQKRHDTLYGWYRVMYDDVPDGIMEVLGKIAAGIDGKAVVNTQVTPSYHSLPSKEDIREFYKKGGRII